MSRIYRGRECEPRPFSDGTGIGVEHLLDGEVMIREHATRVVSAEEKAANDKAVADMATANKRAAALTALIDEKVAATAEVKP
jgi:hypothetical protein